MRRAVLGGMVLATSTLLTACPPLEEPAVDHEAALDELRQAYLSAYNRHDAQAVAQLYAATAVLIDADGSEIRGRDQARDMFQQQFAQFRPQLGVSPIQSDGGERLAWEYGTYQVQPQIALAQPQEPTAQQQPAPQEQQPAQPQQMQPVQGRYLIVLERENDRWVIRAHMNNADLPAMPELDPAPPAEPPVDTPPAAPVDTPPVDAPPEQPVDTPAAEQPPGAS